MWKERVTKARATRGLWKERDGAGDGGEVGSAHHFLGHAGEVPPVRGGVTIGGIGDRGDSDVALPGGWDAFVSIFKQARGKATTRKEGGRTSSMFPLQDPLHLQLRLELLSSIL